MSRESVHGHLHDLQRHRTLAAILGVIFRLPPIKQAMASDQLQSRFLEKMIQRHNAKDAGVL